MNDNYYTISQYVESKTTLEGRILAYDNLIEAMELKMLDNVGESNLDEYQMDDGQMKVRTKYRSTIDILAGIKAIEQARARLLNKLNGRCIVFRGGNLPC